MLSSTEEIGGPERTEALGPSGMIAAPLRIEARALRRGGASSVVRTGMGEKKSRLAAAHVGHAPAVVVAGMCAGTRGLRPGDIVVASEVRDPDGVVHRCPWADELVRALRPLPVPVFSGPLATVRKLVRPAERAVLSEAGIVAADMESAFLLDAAWDGRWAVVRVVSDAPKHELLRPGIVRNGLTAYRSLRAAAPVLSAWLDDADPGGGADLGVARSRGTDEDGGNDVRSE